MLRAAFQKSAGGPGLPGGVEEELGLPLSPKAGGEISEVVLRHVRPPVAGALEQGHEDDEAVDDVRMPRPPLCVAACDRPSCARPTAETSGGVIRRVQYPRRLGLDGKRPADLRSRLRRGGCRVQTSERETPGAAARLDQPPPTCRCGPGFSSALARGVDRGLEGRPRRGALSRSPGEHSRYRGPRTR